MKNLKVGHSLNVEEDAKMALEEGMNNVHQDPPIFALLLLTKSCGIQRQSTTSHFNIHSHK